MPDPRYAPAREDGTKPYVVTVLSSGKTSDRLVYARDRGGARYVAIRVRDYQGHHVQACRRATPEDVTNLKEYR